MKLKIGRYEYDITEKDVFMDNGSCVQLLTQSKEPTFWGGKSSPVLSKSAIKKISVLEKIPAQHKYGDSVQVFSLRLQ